MAGGAHKSRTAVFPKLGHNCCLRVQIGHHVDTIATALITINHVGKSNYPGYHERVKAARSGLQTLTLSFVRRFVCFPRVAFLFRECSIWHVRRIDGDRWQFLRQFAVSVPGGVVGGSGPSSSSSCCCCCCCCCFCCCCCCGGGGGGCWRAAAVPNGRRSRPGRAGSAAFRSARPAAARRAAPSPAAVRSTSFGFFKAFACFMGFLFPSLSRPLLFRSVQQPPSTNLT